MTHVDDFEYCGTEKWIEDVIVKLKATFKVSKDEKGVFKYIGLQIRQAENHDVYIEQHDYCAKLEEIKMSTIRKHQINQPMTENERAMVKTASGKLLWAISQTRVDLSFQGCQVSNSGNNATVRTLMDTNKAIRKIKGEQLEIKYPGLGDPAKMKVIVYADGSHGSLPSGASQGGNIVFLEGNGKSAPISWRSKKIERVTRSPLATEISSVADGADAGHLVASMTKEVFNLSQLPKIELRTDSRSLKEHLETDRVIKDPRLRIDTARLREMRELQELNIVWVPGSEQLADCLTKKAANSDKLKRALSIGALPTAC